MKNYLTKEKKSEQGFSYIDVMIAVVILLIGVLALASALTANLIRSYETDKRIIAKQMALSTIESIISARNINRPGVLEGWHAIGNVGHNLDGGVPKGVFVKGWTPVREDAGWDGVAGTSDDACPAANPCNISGRPINDSEVVKGYERKVVISDVEDAERPTPPNPITRRRVEVTIKYYIKGISRDLTVSTLVTNYLDE